MTQTQNKQN